jgi:hypothetical protein
VLQSRLEFWGLFWGAHPAAWGARATHRTCPMSASNLGKSAAKEQPEERINSRPSCGVWWILVAFGMWFSYF